MYLNEYDKSKFRIPIEEKLFRNPCIENKFKELDESEIYGLTLLSKAEKQISDLNKSSPIERIPKEIFEFKSNKNEHIS